MYLAREKSCHMPQLILTSKSKMNDMTLWDRGVRVYSWWSVHSKTDPIL